MFGPLILGYGSNLHSPANYKRSSQQVDEFTNSGDHDEDYKTEIFSFNSNREPKSTIRTDNSPAHQRYHVVYKKVEQMDRQSHPRKSPDKTFHREPPDKTAHHEPPDKGFQGTYVHREPPDKTFHQEPPDKGFQGTYVHREPPYARVDQEPPDRGVHSQPPIKGSDNESPETNVLSPDKQDEKEPKNGNHCTPQE